MTGATAERFNKHMFFETQRRITVDRQHHPNYTNNPPGKLADAEIRFTDGSLDGLKAIGSGV